MTTKPNIEQIEIAVVATYMEAQSEPAKDHYVFAYTITISNHGAPPSRLMRRHWIITDASGEVEEVRGDGVVGEQPRLASGEKFEYTSGAILKTPVGAMQGSYEFEDDDGNLFEVPIDPFSLSIPNLVH
jgi:ApaG protein